MQSTSLLLANLEMIRSCPFVLNRPDRWALDTLLYIVIQSCVKHKSVTNFSKVSHDSAEFRSSTPKKERKKKESALDLPEQFSRASALACKSARGIEPKETQRGCQTIEHSVKCRDTRSVSDTIPSSVPCDYPSKSFSASRREDRKSVV